MNWKTTLVLLAVVVGLAVWLAIGESTIDTTPTGADTKIFKPPVKVDDVTRVEIARGKNGSSETIVLAKDDKGWRVEKPVTDKADDGKVRELLSSVEFLDAVQKMEGDKAKEAAFGDVALRLSLSRPNDKGGDVTLEFGQSLPGDVRFVRVPGREAVFVIRKELFERASWDLFEFRAKELATLIAAEATKLIAKTESDSQGPNAPPKLLELAKGADGFWHVGGADGEIAETKKATDALDKVRELKPTGIVSEKPSDEDLGKFGLKPAAATISITGNRDGKEQTETLTIGKKIEGQGEARYVRIATRDAVYKADASDLLREVKRDPTSFRSDVLVPLAVGPEGVTSFTAKWRDGTELALRKKDNEWTMVSPGTARGDDAAIRAILKQVTDLKILTREDPNQLQGQGLTDPGLVLTLEESNQSRVVQIGNAAAEEGTFFVRRANEARSYTVKLGELPNKLKDGALTLRTKTLLKAMHWDATAVKLVDSSGKTEVEATKKGAEWTVAGQDPKQIDAAKITKALEPFDELKAESLVAPVVTASLGKWGLDNPKKLTITTESWSTEKNSKVKEDKTLLIGNREGDFVYALDQGGTAIGKVKADFLDVLSRGFRKGKEIWTFSAYDAQSFVVKEGDKEILKLEKRKVGNDDEWYLVSGDKSQKLTSAGDVRDKLLNHWERVEAFGIEDASDAKKKDAGLSPPWRTIVVQTKPAFGDQKDQVTTKTLLLGKRAGERDVWAMELNAPDVGVIFDAPIQKLDAFIASPPVAQVTPPATPEGGNAPVASPDSAAVGSPTK